MEGIFKGIIVAEYPKSGATWLVSMLGDALTLPKRDIYIDNSQKETIFKNHYWFRNQDDIGILDECVIKSHELPGTTRHPDGFKVLHLIRDGRDIVISKYFYETECLVKNGLSSKPQSTFEEFLEKTVTDWKEYVYLWQQQNVMKCRYEELKTETAKTLYFIIKGLGYSGTLQIDYAVSNNTRERMREELATICKHNTFVRKGVIGDWKNYFNNSHKELFKRYAGDLLIELGYEKDHNW